MSSYSILGEENFLGKGSLKKRDNCDKRAGNNAGKYCGKQDDVNVVCCAPGEERVGKPSKKIAQHRRGLISFLSLDCLLSLWQLVLDELHQIHPGNGAKAN